MIRLFAAIAVPDPVAEALVARQQGLAGARWRPQESLHITLRFFAELAEPVADELDLALGAIRVSPFDSALEGAGAFGDEAHTRAVWAGVADSEPLRRLAAKCETAARKVGLAAEHRVFRPHVTLAYLKHSAPERVGAWVQENNLLKSPSFRVDRFGLYSSWQGPDGTRYDLERDYPLL